MSVWDCIDNTVIQSHQKLSVHIFLGLEPTSASWSQFYDINMYQKTECITGVTLSPLISPAALPTRTLNEKHDEIPVSLIIEPVKRLLRPYHVLHWIITAMLYSGWSVKLMFSVPHYNALRCMIINFNNYHIACHIFKDITMFDLFGYIFSTSPE